MSYVPPFGMVVNEVSEKSKLFLSVVSLNGFQKLYVIFLMTITILDD